MIQDTIVPITNQVEKINDYVKWLFKRKEDFVVLKQYVNKSENITKMFIAIPVRERNFKEPKLDLFNPNIFNIPTFPFEAKNIKEYKTLYSGDIFNFQDIVHLLATIKLTKKDLHRNNIVLYKDYTLSKEEQINKFCYVEMGKEPYHSVNSIFRLLHTKYVTIVEVKFNNINSYEA